ncbi:MAG: hypothetical protein EPN93_20310 [Spirochaetes bacterium]|nr:MAG: hypothetical protein EPN93_20310 [Spirochaetota bacterium]
MKKDTKSRLKAVLGAWAIALAAASCTAVPDAPRATPPVLNLRVPDENATDVPLNTNISVSFSEPVTGINNTGGAFTLKKLGAASDTQSHVNYDEAARTATLDPDADLEPDSHYVATVTGGVRDVEGSALDGAPVVWVFTTGPAPDLTNPAVVEKNPDAAAQNTWVGTDVTVRFSEAVSAVNDASFTLTREGGGFPVSATVSYDPQTLTATLNPTVDLEENTNYTAGLSAAVRDTAGNILTGAPVQWSFLTEDRTIPFVNARAPDEGDSGMGTNTVITVSFSEQVMNVTNASFVLRRTADNAPISTIVSYNPVTFSATLDPESDLDPSTGYTIYLSDLIRDTSINHNQLAQTSWGFTTGASQDTAQPFDTERYPETADVPLDTPVYAKFNESVVGVSTVSFTLVRTSDAQPVEATISYNDAEKKASLAPKNTLAELTQYTVTLTGAITDLTGNVLLNAPLTWNFTTGDQTPPSLTDRNPGTDAVDVGTNATVEVTFSEPVTGVSDSTFTLVRVSDGEPVPADITYDAGTFRAVLDPRDDLAETTGYTVMLTAGIKDTTGNALVPFSWNFTTGQRADITAPGIDSKYPEPPADAVPLEDSITVTFNEAVRNVSGTSFTLVKTSDGMQVNAGVSYDDLILTATLDPNEPLQENTQYTVTLTNAIKDVADNMFVQTSWNFTTQADSAPPMWSSRSPEADYNGVRTSANVVVTFDEPVSGVSGTSFYLRQGVTAVPALVVYDPATRTATLDPNASLAVNTVYTVTLTNAIRDTSVNQNQLVQLSWNFTTTDDSTPPTTSLTVPAEGAGGVSRNLPEITIEFSEAMDPDKGRAILMNRTGGQVTGSLGTPAWENGYTRAVFPIIGELATNTEYEVYLSYWGGSFADVVGNLLNGTPYLGNGRLNFTTAADGTAPQVKSTIPAEGSLLVNRNIPRIVIRFNDQMNPAAGSAVLAGTAGVSLGAGVWSEGNRTVSFAVSGTLDENTDHTVTLSGFADTAGNPLDGVPVLADGVLDFTTGSETDTTPILAETFESYADPFFTALINVPLGGRAWNQAYSSNNPRKDPAEGGFMARAATLEWQPGDSTYLETVTPVDMSAPGIYVLSFQMVHENMYNAQDRIDFWADTGNGFQYVTDSAILRFDAYCAGSPAWITHDIDLSAPELRAVVNLRIRAVSAGDVGNNILIDDLKVRRY